MLLEINPFGPEPRKIRRAVDALQAGEVIGYPTDTVYGLGCDMFNKKALNRLYQIKGMDRAQMLAFVCRDLTEISRYAVMHDRVFKILRKYLPGPYCFVLEATHDVPRAVQGHRKTVGVRIPNHPVALALVEGLGHPIVSSTAARHGETPHIDARELDVEFPGLAMVLDCGPGGTDPTTVVDLTSEAPVVIRAGAGDTAPFER
jgi:tRNA threonylcarbamoyl adenosine modification protein (Sua5/YciO/YrdC/YwlC family)